LKGGWADNDDEHDEDKGGTSGTPSGGKENSGPLTEPQDRQTTGQE